MELILASASPRRRRLLALTGLTFRVEVAGGVDEAAIIAEAQTAGPLDAAAAGAVARRLAQRKAGDVVARHPSSLVLGADTVVLADGRVLGKPADAAEARAMLTRLRDRRHEVITGLALVTPDGRLEADRCTVVRMRAYTDAEIDAYIARGEPFDKAGAYAVQDRRFHPVARLAGCYPNVVGLPLCATLGLLRSVGLPATLRPNSPATARCMDCPLRRA